MAEEEKILSIKVEIADAINKIAEYRRLIDELKNKSGELNSDERKSVIEYTEAIRVLNKEVKNNLIVEKQKTGSLKALRADLSNLTKQYDELSRVERESARGTELLTKINNVTKELKEAEMATQRYYRNVGNYASAFNGLGMSVQQVARELPSLSAGFNTFFLAISNNLPILIDQIALARMEYDALIKAGKSATPVWKQLISSIFSWQTALVVGVTALTLYGKEIGNWIKSLVKGKNTVDDLKEAMKDFNKDVGNDAGGMIATVHKLSAEWTKLGDNLNKQEKFVKQNQTEFDKLGISVKSVNDAENALIRNKAALIESLIARAKATAMMEVAASKYKEAVKKMLEAEAMPDEIKYMVNTGNPYQANWVTGTRENQAKKDALKEVADLNRIASELVIKASQLTDEEIKILSGAGIDKAEKAVKEAKQKAEKTLKDLESVLAQLAKDIQKQQLKEEEEYQKRLAQLKVDGAKKGSWEEHAARLAQLKLQRDEELKEFGTTQEMKNAIWKKYNKLMEEETQRHYKDNKTAEENATNEYIKEMYRRLHASQKLTGGMIDLLEEVGESNKAAAVAAKVVGLAEIAIDTGVAIAAAIKNSAKGGGFIHFLTEVGPYIGAILGNMAAAIKTVKSAKFATGGDVKGAGTETSDSVPAMLSNGESVMTARATSMFAPILSAFNQAGGGVPIYGQQTGNRAMGEDMLAKSFAKGLANMPAPVVSVEEISTVTNRVKVIENINRI